MTTRLTNNINGNTDLYINNNIAFGYSNSNLGDKNKLSQPFSRIIDGIKYTIVFNGRIYNKDEIKEKLKNMQCSILTNCDAELALASYAKLGNEFLNLLDGAFCLAIYNNNDNSLFLARDRLGIKPLYYSLNDSMNSEFIFASEIKAILEHPSISAKIGKDEICELFGLGPAHSPGKTFFKGILEILPGSFAIFNNGDFSTYTYWDLKTNQINDNIEESTNKIKELVTNSLKRQIQSEDKICSMLSGGLDSSILAYLCSKEIDNIKTFSIDFEGNETNFTGTAYQPTRDSDFVAIMKDYINSNHTNIYFSTQDVFKHLKDSMIARDMPGMADVDSSMLVFCKKIRDYGYDIAISGECSEEIFGGYPWYYKEHLINSETFPWARSIDIRKNIINSTLVSKEYLENYINNAFNLTSQNVVYNSSNVNENTFRKTCYNTIKWFMNTLIERTDRMSMLSGIDVRIPFADYRIFEYVYNISAKYKLGLINNNNVPTEKYLLRKAFENDLPENVVYRKKSPFPKTYDPKYTKFLEDSIKDIINKSSSPILEIINVKYLYEILESHGENLNENWFGQLMTYPQTLAYLIQINMWLEEYNIQIDI